jgi:hypothetical protein
LEELYVAMAANKLEYVEWCPFIISTRNIHRLSKLCAIIFELIQSILMSCSQTLKSIVLDLSRRK